MHCLVCGDTASGVHYGVLTCEGCKGFFRRALQDKRAHLRQCIRNDCCKITIKTRNHCQPCRLRRCVELGMSREAARLGRRSRKTWKNLDLRIANSNVSDLPDSSTGPEIEQVKTSNLVNIHPSPGARLSGLDTNELKTPSSNAPAALEKNWHIQTLGSRDIFQRQSVSEHCSPNSSDAFTFGSIPSVDTSVSGEWTNISGTVSDETCASRLPFGAQVMMCPNNRMVLFCLPENDTQLSLAPFSNPSPMDEAKLGNFHKNNPIGNPIYGTNQGMLDETSKRKYLILRTIQERSQMHDYPSRLSKIADEFGNNISTNCSSRLQSVSLPHDDSGCCEDTDSNKNHTRKSTITNSLSSLSSIRISDGMSSVGPVLIITPPNLQTPRINPPQNILPMFNENARNQQDMTKRLNTPEVPLQSHNCKVNIFSELLRSAESAFTDCFKTHIANSNKRRTKEEILVDNEETMKRLFGVSRWEEGKSHVRSVHEVQTTCFSSFQQRFNEIMQDVVRFAKCIPGFSQIPPEDRITLVQSGCFEVACLVISLYIDDETLTLHAGNRFVLTQSQMYWTFPMGNKFIDLLFDFCLQIKHLKLESIALGLLSTVILLSPERMGLANSGLIIWLHELISNAFSLQTLVADADGSAQLSKILKAIACLDELVAEHQLRLTEMKSKGFTFLNDLYSETFGLG